MTKTKTSMPKAKTVEKPAAKKTANMAVKPSTKPAPQSKAETKTAPEPKKPVPQPNPLYPSKKHGKKSGSDRGNVKKVKKSI